MRSRDLFARKLREFRLAKGLSQEALAHEANMHRTYVSALERSIYSASLDTIDDLADALGVAPVDFLKSGKTAD